MSAIDWIAYVIAYTRRMSLLTCADVWHASLLSAKMKFLGQYYYLFEPNGNKESSLLLYKFLLLDKERLVRGSCQLPPTSFIFRN